MSIMGFSSRTALIIGVNSQDGAYLAELLLSKGYNVYGGIRQFSPNGLWRLDELKIADQIKFVNLDLTEYVNIRNAIEKIKPDEVYNLAAQNYVGVSFEKPILTGEINGLAVARLLEAIREVNPKIKFFQASSAEMFGKVKTIPQTEKTPFYPRNPYGVAKLYGHWTTINHRESYDMFCCSGILFNHESPLRAEDYLTRKISVGFSKICRGEEKCISLGNLHSKRDWGYAKEYVEGMWLMLQQPKADDYILSTGVLHSIKEFVEIAAEYLGMDLVWEENSNRMLGKDRNKNQIIVETDPKFFRADETELLVGDYSKAKEKLGWEPKTSLKDLVGIMIESDLKKLEKRINTKTYA